MLTPLDIHNKEFKRSLRGYDINEVDEFLDEVIKDFETLYKENMELREEVNKQKEQVNRYREIEETLQNTMVLAQKMAEEAKRNTEKETELAIWEARKKAEQIISQAHDEVTETIRKVEQLKAFEKQMKTKMRSYLVTQLQLLDETVLDKDEGEPSEDDVVESYGD